jgi:hypothetical protein
MIQQWRATRGQLRALAGNPANPLRGSQTVRVKSMKARSVAGIQRPQTVAPKE